MPHFFPEPVDEEERVLFGRVAQWSEGLDALTPQRLREITACEGCDFATALLHRRIVESEEHGAFLRALGRSCDALVAESSCDALVAGRAAGAPQAPSAAGRRSYGGVRVAIVPGAFYRENPCTGADGRVAREVASLLGLPVEVVPVSSTGSLAENARLIAEWLLAHRDASLLLVSVSKGGSDLKAALARPDAAHVFSRVVGWVNPLFLAGPFIVRERREFAALIRALALATFIGGLGFLLVPAQPAFPPHSDPGLWAGLSRFADWLNLDYNMAPSLHVALSVCCVAIFSRRASRTGHGLLWLWAFGIALSTVLTHQHHLVDALTGWALGIAAARQFSPPFPQEKVTQ